MVALLATALMLAPEPRFLDDSLVSPVPVESSLSCGRDCDARWWIPAGTVGGAAAGFYAFTWVATVLTGNGESEPVVKAMIAGAITGALVGAWGGVMAEDGSVAARVFVIAGDVLASWMLFGFAWLASCSLLGPGQSCE